MNLRSIAHLNWGGYFALLKLCLVGFLGLHLGLELLLSL